MGKRILGLDLGTNSIGWGVMDDLGEGQFKLLEKGVHVFPEGTNRDSAGSESSKASDRTQHRSARRLKYRRKLRKIETLKVLSDEGLCPKLEMSELNAWRYDRKYPSNTLFRNWCRTSDPTNGEGEFDNPYYFRWLASTEKLDWDSEPDSLKLGRALYHLAQRRGFKSNRLDASSDDVKGELRERLLDVLEMDFSELSELCDAIASLAEGIEDKAVLRFHKGSLKIAMKQSGLEAAQKLLREHLNKRENLGPVKGGIVDLTQEMAAKGCATLGQLFWKEYYCCGKRIRSRYTSREEHYEDEFSKICEMQGFDAELRKKLYDTIFFQRPLKSQKGMVAKCPFEQSKKRAPISHPLFEEFRMWQTLNNIKTQPWGDDELRPLTAEEKAAVIPKFQRAKVSFDFSDIAGFKNLTPAGQDYGYIGDKDSAAHVKFNYRPDQSISGCPLTAALMRLFGKDDYEQAMFEAYRGEKHKKVDGETKPKTPDDIVNEVWHVLFSFDKPEMLKAYGVNKLGLCGKGATAFSKIKPRQGYGALSLSAIRRILPYLRQGHIYSHAVFFANLPAVIGGAVSEFPEIEKEMTEIIDSHGRYQKRVKLTNYFHELRRKKPEDIEYWISKGWNPWCVEVGKASTKLFGIEQWDELGESGQERLCLETRDMLNGLPDDTGFIELLTVEKRIKDYLLEWADAQGKRAEVETRLEKLYHPSKEELYEPVRDKDGKPTELGNPEISSIRNPVFNRAMHRLKTVVNELIRTKKIDESTVVHLELAREMNDANRRAALRIWQKGNEESRANAVKVIETHYKDQGHENEKAFPGQILKYQLWLEQEENCPYCDTKIGFSEVLTEQTEVEHTIPRSKCCDNSKENKTVAHKACNQRKNNRIPFECEDYEKILQRIDHWRGRVNELDHLIERKKNAAKHAADKDAKDKIIQARLILQFERNYLWGKYRRFTMKDAPEGFKNSQLVDTRIITKYARSYLRSFFPTVHTVNGKITDDFRHYWGLQKDGEEKDRGNHVHHAIDAIVAACITRRQYQQLAEAYGKSEKGKEKFRVEKPWGHFVEDMNGLRNEILISHYAPNHLLKQTKKKVKVRGKVVVQQGQTARGSLHKDTFYGAIKRQEKNRKTGEIEEAIKYVVRKPVSDLTTKDIDNVVDDKIREILRRPIELQGEIKELRKKLRRTADEDKKPVQEKMASLQSELESLKPELPNKNGDPVPIKKVRICSSLTNPIELKKQRDKSMKNPKLYKERYYVNNDGNYLMAIYEEKNERGKDAWASQIVGNLSAVKLKAGNLVSLEKDGLPLKCIVRGGMMVFLMKDTEIPSDIWGMDGEERASRLYIIRGIDDDGIKLYYHGEARQTTEVLKHMNAVITESNRRNNVLDKKGNVKASKLTTPKGGTPDKLLGQHDDYPYVKIQPSNFNALLEPVDFRLNVLGEVEFMEE